MRVFPPHCADNFVITPIAVLSSTGRTEGAYLCTAKSTAAGSAEGRRKSRVLSIPAIRDRVVQGALKLILEPIFEAGSTGVVCYRPKRTAHEAVNRVATAIVQRKTRIIDLDLRAYFDTVRHHRLLEKVACRINDNEVMRLQNLMLTASGKQGVPQGGVITPLTQKVILNSRG
jgi:RNA-directed DNA polymerase